MKKIILFPLNGNTKEAIASITRANQIKPQWKIVSIIDHNDAILESQYFGIEICNDVEKSLAAHPGASLLAVPGSPVSFLKREHAILSLAAKEEAWTTVIDPSAVIADNAKIGKNCLILANVVIGPSVVLGDHCIVLPNTVIGHDTNIEEYTILGANVSISGSCHIGRMCYIATASSVKDNVNIAAQTLCGMGSNIVNSIVEPNSIVIGNPARQIGMNKL
ncbi:MAG: sugar O-acyltransferase (sialic acid O-acetyltransferase NeuD family) [Candidatus Omnitrophota bacterium]|jgi:sugar O-acyltransferase (sialic acid O-acetyltransferase NeuD family)